MSKNAKKKQKNVLREEIQEIQVQIKKCWPDYSLSEQCLADLSPEFVADFYSMYLNTFYDLNYIYVNCPLIKELINNSESVGSYFMNRCPKTVEKELFLFSHLNYIFHQLSITYFSLTDLYRPPNRTRTTIKILLHLLLYIINLKTETTENFERVYKELEKALNSQHAHNELLEKLCNYSDENGEMMEYLENEEMIKKTLLVEVQEIEEMEKENQELEAKLKALKEKVKPLDEQNNKIKEEIVDANSFEAMAKEVKVQQEILAEKDVDIKNQQSVINVKSNDLNRLKSILNLLEAIDMNCLHSFEEFMKKEADVEREKVHICSLKNEVNSLKNVNCKDKASTEELMNKISEENESHQKTCQELTKMSKHIVESNQNISEQCEILKLKENALKQKSEQLYNECEQIKTVTEEIISIKDVYYNDYEMMKKFVIDLIRQYGFFHKS